MVKWRQPRDTNGRHAGCAKGALQMANASENATTGAMGELDKIWFIHDNMTTYQDYCKKNGSNTGFKFPDGSRITAHDADDFLVF